MPSGFQAPVAESQHGPPGAQPSAAYTGGPWQATVAALVWIQVSSGAHPPAGSQGDQTQSLGEELHALVVPLQPANSTLAPRIGPTPR